jgi:hypothetical protein
LLWSLEGWPPCRPAEGMRSNVSRSKVLSKSQTYPGAGIPARELVRFDLADSKCRAGRGDLRGLKARGAMAGLEAYPPGKESQGLPPGLGRTRGSASPQHGMGAIVAEHLKVATDVADLFLRES